MLARKLLTRPVWPAALLLWVMFALALTSMASEGPTFDEQGFLVRGLAYLRGPDNGGTRAIRVGHPLGLNALNAALLVNDPGVRLPSDDPAWGESGFHRPAELFLWGIGNDVARTLFLARLPTLWLGVLLAAVVGRWAGQMAAGWRLGRVAAGGAGLLALALLALDPNVLAHMRLVTTDLGLAAAAALAGYTLWRFLRRPAWPSAVLAGVALGLLQNTKFTALLFLPLFGVVILCGLWRRRRALGRRALALIFLVYPAVALLTLWAGNGFQVGALHAPLPLLGTLGGAAVPLSDHLDQLLDIGGRLQVSTPAFLLGRYADTGWWAYFPVAFALKTPLPTLLLLVYAVFRIAAMALRERGTLRAIGFDLVALLVPAAGYFAIALTTSINLGYRHLLPVLPFLYVMSGVVIARAAAAHLSAGRQGGAARVAAPVAVAIAWLALAALWMYPHYLAFFNVLAGGPDNGWRALVDSNIDWGQDLGRLKTWLDDNDVGRVWLSYFGEGRPEYYGIAYDGLDSWPPRLMNPNARPFYPPDPAPGWYAISATTLQGVHFADHDEFLFFRRQRPLAKVGYSIFLYHVAPRGAPVDLLLAGTQMDALAAADFARLRTNDVTPRWFDPSQAVVLPAGDAPLWLLLPAAGQPAAALRPYLSYGPAAVASTDGYRLYLATGKPPAAGRVLSLDGHEVAFGQDSWARQDGRTIETVTIWRQGGAPRPAQIFIHVLDAGGELVAQWDGLDAAWEGWRAGDTLIQLATVTLPETAPAGDYRVVAGLYDPTTNQRWRFADGQDSVELGQFAIANP